MHPSNHLFVLSSFILLSLCVPFNHVRAQSNTSSEQGNSEARVLMDQGKQAFGQKDFATAAALFRKAFLADKSQVLAQYNYAFALRKAGSFEAARDAYQEYVALVPQDLDGLFGLAETERLLGDEGKAAAYFSEYLQRENRPGKESYVAYAQKFAQIEVAEGAGDKQALLKKAEQAYQAKEYVQAAGFFEQAFEIDRKDLAVGLRYALSLRKGGNYDKAIAIYEELRKAGPKELDSLFGLAETFRLAKKNADALKHFQDYVSREQRAERKSYIAFAQKQISALTPNDSALENAEDIFNKGMVAYKAKDYPQAIQLFDAAYELDAQFVKALYRKALSLRKLKDYEGARKTYLLYLEKAPEDVDALYGLATTEKLAKNVPEARRYFKEYIELEKRPSEAKYVAKAKKYLADTEPQSGEEQPVEEKIEKPAAVAQNEAPASEVPANEAPASQPQPAKESSAQTEEPVAAATEETIIAEPKIPLELQTHEHEGPSRHHTTRLGQALTAAKLIRVGELMLDRYKNPIGATQYLQLALTMEPENQEAHLALGRTYLHQGRTAEAKQSLSRAISFNGENEHGQRAQRLLANLAPGNVMARTPTAKEVEKARAKVAEGVKALDGDQDEEAVAHFKKAVGYDPYRADSYLRLGEALRRTANHTKALDAYRRAASLAPDSVVPVWELAQTYEKMGELRTARHHYELVMRSDAPDATSALKRKAWLKVEGAI